MSDFQRLFLASVGAGMTLAAWGWASTPGVSLLWVSGVYIVLFAYALAGYRGVPFVERIQPPVVQFVVSFGLVAGFVSATEIALKYAVLPIDNSLMGQVELGFAGLLYFAAGLLAILNTNRWRDALSVAAGTSILASLLWLVAILFTFYLFRGTPTQIRVLFADGLFDDFARSGAANFDGFVMENFFRASFFRLLLGPLAGLLLGALVSTVVLVRTKLGR